VGGMGRRRAGWGWAPPLLALVTLAAGCGGMALAVVGAVFGEWVGASRGLGYLMLALNNQLATADLFAAVLVLSLLGIALFFLVGLAERLAIPWHHQPRRAPRP
jgi:ABC-type nitrate/sulfonate/bicarbonate transport system permease component